MSGVTRAGRSLRVLISSGPTREPIDPVRFLSNYSTGFMGACLAREAQRRGHRVTVVSGPVSIRPPRGIQVVWIEQARQMQTALRRYLDHADVVIMAAAVCDFQPDKPRSHKLPRRGTQRLVLKATPDILGHLPRRDGQLRVGFALDTSRVLARGRAKLRAKQLDLLVAQHPNGTGGPFGNHPVNAVLITAAPARRSRLPGRAGDTQPLGTLSKPRLARTILDEIERLWYGVKHTRRPRAQQVRKQPLTAGAHEEISATTRW